MLKRLLTKNNIESARVIKFDQERLHHFDLSKNNKELDKIDLNDEQQFTEYIQGVLDKNDCTAGIGGYGEERSLYSRSELFTDEEPRTIHLGVDIWTKAGTSVYSPLEATVHSFANHRVHGDYGPVIILEHEIEDQVFYTLYGHLSTMSLHGLYEGKLIKKGEQFASLGAYHENFHWPPHLHFQIMMDLEGYKGDYPGVCKSSEKEIYLDNCPDPKVFLGS
ncbi:MAG: peptidoglycan DD-metalloendopeptidase family protein [Cytophagia bacterium]|nr:peptidoglycan DD-metalloendopeptidase family protein [Cytophagia bacterium]